MRVFRLLGIVAACAMAMPGLAQQTSAQLYPMKPIRVVVPFVPGGMTDIMGRTVAGMVEKALGQPALVENRGGAGGQVGTAMVARAAPDGYTLLLGSLGTHGIAPVLYRKLAYDPVKDFEHIAMLALVGNLLVVHPSIPAGNLKEFIALAKRHPGKLNYGAIGGSSHLMTELINNMAGTKTVHVPYKGGAAALVGVLSGEIDYVVTSLSLLLPHVESGKLRALAVTPDRRSPLAPHIPTMSEAGLPGYNANTWFSLVAPGGTPRTVVTRLNEIVASALKSPEIVHAFAKLNAEIKIASPGETVTFLESEIAKWHTVVKASGIQQVDQ